MRNKQEGIVGGQTGPTSLVETGIVRCWAADRLSQTELRRQLAPPAR
jgi:hypothetical protein